MPKVSVIIPTYNRAKFLPRTIDNVLCQTYQDFEILVIDDGSSDNTREIMQEYIKKHTGKIRYFYKENGGVPTARNLGIQLSNAEFIAFLDSDDIWDADKLKYQMQYMDEHPQIYMCNTDVEYIDEDDKSLGYSKRRNKIPFDGMVFRYVFQHHGIVTSTMVVKKCVFDKIGLLDENLPIGDDTDIILRIAKSFQIGFIEKPLVKYRMHNMNISKHADTHLYHLKAVEKVLKADPDFAKNNKRLVFDVLSAIYVDYIEDLLSHNDFKEAQKRVYNYLTYAKFSPRGQVLFLKTSFMNFLGVEAVGYLRGIKKNNIEAIKDQGLLKRCSQFLHI